MRIKKSKIFVFIISTFLTLCLQIRADTLNACNIIENGFRHEFGLEWPTYQSKLIGYNKVFDDATKLLIKEKSYDSYLAHELFNQDKIYINKAFMSAAEHLPAFIPFLQKRIQTLSHGELELLLMSSEEKASNSRYHPIGELEFLKLQDSKTHGKVKKDWVILTLFGFMTYDSFALSGSGIQYPSHNDLSLDDDWLGQKRLPLPAYYIKHYENAVQFLIKGKSYYPGIIKNFINDKITIEKNESELKNAFFNVFFHSDQFSKKLIEQVAIQSKGLASLAPVATRAISKVAYRTGYQAARYFFLSYVKEEIPYLKLVAVTDEGILVLDHL